MSSRSWIAFLVIVQCSVFAKGQTAESLAAKYPVVSAFEVRPGVLMTAQYAQDRQVCEIQLARHYTPDQPDVKPTIPPELQTQLIDEIIPNDQRGSRIGKWLGNSFVGGGITHEERNFESALIELDGTVDGGVEMIEIHWKKRSCVQEKSGPSDFHKAHVSRGTNQ
jgi:hypothetical protein